MVPSSAPLFLRLRGQSSRTPTLPGLNRPVRSDLQRRRVPIRAALLSSASACARFGRRTRTRTGTARLRRGVVESEGRSAFRLRGWTRLGPHERVVRPLPFSRQPCVAPTTKPGPALGHARGVCARMAWAPRRSKPSSLLSAGSGRQAGAGTGRARRASNRGRTCRPRGRRSRGPQASAGSGWSHPARPCCPGQRGWPSLYHPRHAPALSVSLLCAVLSIIDGDGGIFFTHRITAVTL